MKTTNRSAILALVQALVNAPSKLARSHPNLVFWIGPSLRTSDNRGPTRRMVFPRLLVHLIQTGTHACFDCAHQMNTFLLCIPPHDRPRIRHIQDVQNGLRQGRSKRGGEAYVFWYVEPLSAARTKLGDIFNILCERILLLAPYPPMKGGPHGARQRQDPTRPVS